MRCKVELIGLTFVMCVVTLAFMVQPAAAQVAGAIWTTLPDGSVVDGNIYALKTDVYLNGGPGMGAGTNAPGLDPDGTYVFMVTDPSGKTLLSTDNAECRQVEVINGSFAGAVGPCPHAEGTAAVGVPVQLIPYDDTPNNGGEYKVWLTPLDKYTCPTDQVSCDSDNWGFIPRWSKTDNFKVKEWVWQEIDTEFIAPDGRLLDGYSVQWIDTLGASNTKWTRAFPGNWHVANVEAVEEGVHYIILEDQPGCTIGHVVTNRGLLKKFGPQAVPIRITNGTLKKGNFTELVTVYCSGQ